ncbi:MAG: hypothetical protein OXU96_02805, partial [Gammaproteobacteria bacterium]|nr:hypothetical protein [Gammaproteobacteria bacterium]
MTSIEIESGPPAPVRQSGAAVAWRELKKAPLTAQFGLVVIAFYLLIALFAQYLAPHGESEIVGAEFEPRF